MSSVNPLAKVKCVTIPNYNFVRALREVIRTLGDIAVKTGRNEEDSTAWRIFLPHGDEKNPYSKAILGALAFMLQDARIIPYLQRIHGTPEFEQYAHPENPNPSRGALFVERLIDRIITFFINPVIMRGPWTDNEFVCAFLADLPFKRGAAFTFYTALTQPHFAPRTPEDLDHDAIAAALATGREVYLPLKAAAQELLTGDCYVTALTLASAKDDLAEPLTLRRWRQEPLVYSFPSVTSGIREIADITYNDQEKQFDVFLAPTPTDPSPATLTISETSVYGVAVSSSVLPEITVYKLKEAA